MQFSLQDILLLFVIFQLFFISIFLFSKETGKKISNVLLGFFFLSFSLSLADSFLLKNELYINHPSLATWSGAFPLLYGPLLYLYTQSLLFSDFKITIKRLLHLVPFVLFFIFSFVAYSIQSTQQKQIILEQIKNRQVAAYFYFIASFFALHFCLYAFICLKLIKQYRKLANEKVSDMQLVNLSWLSSTIIFFTALFIFSIVNNFVALTSFAKYYSFSLTIIIIAVFIFINRVLFKALKKPEIFSWANEKEIQKISVDEKQISEATNIDKENLSMLLNYMQLQKPFLEPELTVENLAAKTGLKTKELSKLINENLHQNFFDFVNRYRIEEAKKLLNNPADKKITVLEVLYEVGFNSKSSFNTLFKKYTGITPSEFKKKSIEAAMKTERTSE